MGGCVKGDRDGWELRRKEGGVFTSFIFFSFPKKGKGCGYCVCRCPPFLLSLPFGQLEAKKLKNESNARIWFGWPGCCCLSSDWTGEYGPFLFVQRREEEREEEEVASSLW